MDRIPVLLDTDIGSDIDDAVALAYLLREPRCDLLGITTVTGDVGKRAALAEVVCRAAGRDDVPIHLGAPEVLLTGPGQPDVPQYDAIRETAHRTDRAPATAVPFLAEQIRARPHELTLLTIGPLTNIALLFAMDPELPAMLRALVTMGGCHTGDRREWNCLCDPVAAQMVMRARVAEHAVVGVDVTSRCTLPAEQVRARFTTPPLDAVYEMARIWYATADHNLTFHDPLAAVTVFEPSVCNWARGEVTVADDGTTRFTEDQTARRTVATDVDVERFFERFFAVFS